MTRDRLETLLAERVMGWKACPDRFIKSGRSWIPRWRFKPLVRLEDAFLLLDRAGGTYVLSVGSDGVFTAEVRVGERIGKASGEPQARVITIALAGALGLELPDESSDPSSASQRRRNPQFRSKVDGV